MLGREHPMEIIIGVFPIKGNSQLKNKLANKVFTRRANGFIAALSLHSECRYYLISACGNIT